MVIVIVVYQQLENYLLSPRITAHTMSIHAAVAFGSVIAGAALLGIVGALLAIPVAATTQAVVASVAQRHDVADELIVGPGQERTRRWIRRSETKAEPNGSGEQGGVRP